MTSPLYFIKIGVAILFVVALMALCHIHLNITTSDYTGHFPISLNQP